MRNYLLIIFTFLLSSATCFAAGVLNDSDIPALREALKSSYTTDLCQKDLPNASVETCQCLADAMSENLDAEKLKLCKKEGYDECVATEFTAAKSNLTEKQINDCKAISTKKTPSAKEDKASDKASDDESNE